MRRPMALALLLLPSLASASPGVSGELVLGVQDVPDTYMLNAQPRLVLRLDRDADLTAYGRVGFATTVWVDGRMGHGTALEAAAGVEARQGLLQLRAGLGAQRASYRKTYETSDSSVDHESTSAFVELQPQLVFAHVVIGVDLRAHHVLVGDVADDGWVGDRWNGLQYAAGVSLGVRF